jgi:hypothetical protein
MRQHIIDGTTMKRICGDDTQYDYVSDEILIYRRMNHRLSEHYI